MWQIKKVKNRGNKMQLCLSEVLSSDTKLI